MKNLFKNTLNLRKAFRKNVVFLYQAQARPAVIQKARDKTEMKLKRKEKDMWEQTIDRKMRNKTNRMWYNKKDRETKEGVGVE